MNENLVSGDVLAAKIKGLSCRATNALASLGIETVGDLAMLSRHELKTMKNVGETTILEMERYLERLGLCLASVSSGTSMLRELNERVKKLEERT